MSRQLHIVVLLAALMLAAQIHLWTDLDHAAGLDCPGCASSRWALAHDGAVPKISLRAFHLEMAGGSRLDASHLVDVTPPRAPPC